MDALKPALSSLVAAGIGLLAWRASPLLIPVSLAFPAFVFAQHNRRAATLVAFSYYAAASWTVVEVSGTYFAGGTSAGILPWLCASTLLTTPWAALWSRDAASWRLPLALIATTVPPIGLIDWASPITSAGFLFPGLGFAGIAATVAVMVSAASRHVAVLVWLGLLSVAANTFCASPQPPADWVGFDTHFGVVHDPRNPIPEFQASDTIQQEAASSNAKVFVFPEGVVPRWTEATDAFWKTTIDHAAQRGAVLLVGAAVPVAKPSPRLRNIIAIRGASTAEFEQRIPVPLAMWKPWGKDRVSLNLTGNATAEIGSEHVAILICYEQLLPWSYLSAFIHRPTVLLGVANASWTKHTAVPQYQQAALHSWARLFGKPVISATNY